MSKDAAPLAVGDRVRVKGDLREGWVTYVTEYDVDVQLDGETHPASWKFKNVLKVSPPASADDSVACPECGQVMPLRHHARGRSFCSYTCVSLFLERDSPNAIAAEPSGRVSASASPSAVADLLEAARHYAGMFLQSDSSLTREAADELEAAARRVSASAPAASAQDAEATDADFARVRAVLDTWARSEPLTAIGVGQLAKAMAQARMDERRRASAPNDAEYKRGFAGGIDEQRIRGPHAQRDGEAEGEGDRDRVRRAPRDAEGALPGEPRILAGEDEARGGVLLRQEGDGEQRGEHVAAAQLPSAEPRDRKAGVCDAVDDGREGKGVAGRKADAPTGHPDEGTRAVDASSASSSNRHAAGRSSLEDRAEAWVFREADDGRDDVTSLVTLLEDLERETAERHRKVVNAAREFVEYATVRADRKCILLRDALLRELAALGKGVNQ